jgi:sialic acid synthase SpsE
MQPLIIAELGTAHGGSAACARELIDAAAFAGADGVKFQIVYADEILHPNTGTVPLPGGDTPLYEVFKKLETPPDFFAGLKQYTESKNLLFLATPFGLRSATELKALAPKAVKIASPELNYTHLVREVAGWNIPAYLSTGVSTLAGIESALEFFNSTVCRLHFLKMYLTGPHAGTYPQAKASAFKTSKAMLINSMLISLSPSRPTPCTPCTRLEPRHWRDGRGGLPQHRRQNRRQNRGQFRTG